MFAVLGAGAVLAATTQGPISTVVLMMELTGRDRSFVVPLLLAVAAATLVARTIERQRHPHHRRSMKCPDGQTTGDRATPSRTNRHADR
jgi:H+/Cl- antiporter ClcA